MTQQEAKWLCSQCGVTQISTDHPLRCNHCGTIGEEFYRIKV